MAAKHDIQRGITAEITATMEQLVEACQRTVEPISEAPRLEAQVERQAGKVLLVVRIKPLLRSNAKGKLSLLLVLDCQQAEGEGRLYLKSGLARYRTIQSKVFFLPAGPKRLASRQTYFRVLDALENELRVLDTNASIWRY